MYFYRRKPYSLEEKIAAYQLNKGTYKIILFILFVMLLLHCLTTYFQYKTIHSGDRINAKILSITKKENYKSLDDIKIVFEYIALDKVKRQAEIEIPVISLDENVIYKDRIFLRYNGTNQPSRFYQDSNKELYFNCFLNAALAAVLALMLFSQRKMARLSKIYKPNNQKDKNNQ